MKKEFVMSKMIVDRNGEDIEVDIEGWVEYSVDRFYGTDADGNRGESRIFAEDIDGVNAWELGGDELELTPQEIKVAEDKLIDKFLMDR